MVLILILTINLDRQRQVMNNINFINVKKMLVFFCSCKLLILQF